MLSISALSRSCSSGVTATAGGEGSLAGEGGKVKDVSLGLIGGEGEREGYMQGKREERKVAERGEKEGGEGWV